MSLCGSVAYKVEKSQHYTRMKFLQYVNIFFTFKMVYTTVFELSFFRFCLENVFSKFVKKACL